MGVAGQRQPPDRGIVLLEPFQTLRDLGAGGSHRLERGGRQWLQGARSWGQMPDRHRVGVDVVRLERVAGWDRCHATADRVDVAEREPRHRRVRGRRPDRTVDREGRLDDVQQMGHDLVVAQLLGGLGDHRQIPLERPHLMVGNDEVGSLQARLGDVAAEHPLRHDLRLDRDPLAAPRCLG